MRRRTTLAEVKAGSDMTAIRNATLALDKATQRLAELMMDAAVSSALRGKTMNAAGEELDDNVTAPSSHGSRGIQIRTAFSR